MASGATKTRRFSLSELMALLDVFSLCTSAPLMFAKRFFALVDDLVRYWVNHRFRVMIIVAIYAHYATDPPLRFTKETVTTFLF